MLQLDEGAYASKLPRMLATVIILFCTIGTTNAYAIDPNGMCLMENECMAEKSRIAGNQYGTCESTCVLHSPEPLSGLNATKYDIVCAGDWGARPFTAIFIKLENYGNSPTTAMITENSIEELVSCD
ncbi:hypothetical protein [Ahrensia sp. 13_GOM-1096m]|uniref:hypothetical protein n=1 Tax=Ahrensia sp. 13_GOM-1096m TaxID=1380380 RepID=UPI00047ACB92|nr:hypothetical protein [Ahrensia sp. 13_GOM-1096m]